ncbi:sulfate reduction electron transfer complex DsrMKJOP subunit DsrK [Candidatus Magnetominusculus dajiuhuensis]|uniref:sulfate reduction electron transfer complex DsrMKJOP subunit DsrK n=1 Tax=Candidatus Magnetominusculus dajiuhuensis TaxID=3137712 RepID=UPI003B42CEFC
MAEGKTAEGQCNEACEANERIQEQLKFSKIKVKAPKLTGEIDIPDLDPNSMLSVKPQLLTAKEMLEHLGYPAGGLVPNWKEVFLRKMDEILKKYRSVRLYMDICVKCGACVDKCHYYLGTGDPLNMPVARQELMRKVYRRYFTLPGKLFGSRFVNGSDLSEELLVMWYTYFYQCSECRRCSVFCPYGIDTAEITMAAREILNSVGIVQKYMHEIIFKAQTIGNNLGMQQNAIINALEFVQEELQEETGLEDIKIPIDVEGAEVLFVTPSADFFASPHIESLYGYAKVFHQAGISWTMSTHASEGGNFGMFAHNYEHMKKINKRIWEAARALKVRRVVGGECGHMWRVLSSFSNTMWGPFDYLDQKYMRPQHICEVTLDLLKRGALKIDKSANEEFIVTMHDSCQVARGMELGGVPNGQFDIPRDVIRGVCEKFVDMPAETIRERTFCCGAGQGLLGDDMMATRVKGAMPRMQAYHYAKRESGVNFVALICAICKAQLSKMFPEYGIAMEEVGGIHQLVGRAIVLGAKESV